MELLACKTRQDKEIQGINIFGNELKLSQFPDVGTRLISNCNLINKAIVSLNNFGDIYKIKRDLPFKVKFDNSSIKSFVVHRVNMGCTRTAVTQS